MDKQNITLSLPKDLLRKVRHIAVEKETSVSALLAQTLEDLTRADDAYEVAKRRHKVVLESGFELGTAGRISWQRESLHER